MRRACAVAIACVALAPAGCGGDDSDTPTDEDAAGAAAVEWVQAVGDGDEDAACALVVERIQGLTEDPTSLMATDCDTLAREAEGVEFPEADTVELDGDEAEVEVIGSGGVTLSVEVEQEGDEWRVSDAEQIG